MLMIVVNNPGNWRYRYAPLAHCAWDGCTPTDLVFPTFLFCVGVAMAFSLARFEGLTKAALGKIGRRTGLLFLVGLALNAFPFFPVWDKSLGFWENYGPFLHNIRIFGILQRIALCYGLGSILALWLRKPGRIGAAAIILGTVYTAILLIFGEKGAQFTLEGNISAKVDLALVGDSHCYHGYGIAFDPEGPLGVMTGTCTALIGYLIGMMIRRSGEAFELSGRTGLDNSPQAVSAKTFCLGIASLSAGEILSIWIPVNKPLWSVSYVLFAAGWAMLVLGLLIYLVDAKGHSRIFEPARAMGSNALVLFVLSGLLGNTLWRILKWSPAAICNSNFTSLLYSLCYLLVLSVIGWTLYKKKIYIRL